MNLITGEKIQYLADIYLGLMDDFNYNPYIRQQKNKHKDISQINELYDNPTVMFCYSHRIYILADKIDYFKNPFILITHNSDENIIPNNLQIQKLYNCKNLIKWFAQNLCFSHDKIQFIPIGIANQQWEHGIMFNHFYYNKHSLINKISKSVYFFFEISTNKEKRMPCFNALKQKIPFLNKIQPMDNFERLRRYEFCICPEGNGIDTHRFWEALYLHCVPVVIKNPLVEIIKNTTNLPMIILNSWDEFKMDSLPNYNHLDFSGVNFFLDLNYYIKIIKY